MDNGFFYDVLIRRLPVMLVVLAGIVFAIVRCKRHPKVSSLTIAGLVLLQLQTLTFSFVYHLLPRLETRGWTWTAIDNLSIAVELCHDLFFSAAIALLAAAVFSGRNPQTVGSQAERLTPI